MIEVAKLEPEPTKGYSFLFSHPVIICTGNTEEPTIERTIPAVSLGEAITYAKEALVIGRCGHTYELAATPHK